MQMLAVCSCAMSGNYMLDNTAMQGITMNMPQSGGIYQSELRLLMAR